MRGGQLRIVISLVYFASNWPLMGHSRRAGGTKRQCLAFSLLLPSSRSCCSSSSSLTKYTAPPLWQTRPVVHLSVCEENNKLSRWYIGLWWLHWGENILCHKTYVNLQNRGSVCRQSQTYRLPWVLRPVGTWRGFLKIIRKICDVDIINKPRMKLSKPWWGRGRGWACEGYT